MKIEVKAKFNSIEELNAWLDNVCTRCAMCNREGRDRCDVCRANKIYKNVGKKLGLNEEELKDDD